MKRPEKSGETVLEQTCEFPVLDRTDVLVVGGGPAGLAAGTTAAMAVQHGVTPRGMGRTELHESLLRQGVRLS